MKTRRRDFLKMVLVGVGTVAVLPRLGYAEERRRGSGGAAGAAELPLVEPGKGTAAAVNYVHKQADLKDATLKKERQGVAFAKQNCSGCQFYTANGKRGSDEVGKCTIFQGQVVKAQGWCSTWTKKA